MILILATLATAFCVSNCGSSDANNNPNKGNDSGVFSVDARADTATGHLQADAATSVADMGASPEDAGKSPDSGSVKLDAHADSASALFPTGGKLVVTCPASGFHKPPPITIASLPKSLLPRCSSATLNCVNKATSSAGYQACLAADNTSPVTFDNETIDCEACDLTANVPVCRD